MNDVNAADGGKEKGGEGRRGEEWGEEEGREEGEGIERKGGKVP